MTSTISTNSEKHHSVADMSKEPASPLRRKGHSKKDEDHLDAYSQDLIHLMERYVNAMDGVLKVRDPALGALTDKDGLPILPEAPPEKKTKKEGEDDSSSEDEVEEASIPLDPAALRISQATKTYLERIQNEHAKWMKANDQNIDIYVGARRQDMELLKRYYAEPLKKMKDVVRSRADVHFANFKAPPPPTGNAKRRHTNTHNKDNSGQYEFDVERDEIKARTEWVSAVCKAVVAEIRQEWRDGQRNLLTSLAKEMQSSRQAALALLKGQAAGWDSVMEKMQAIWDLEFQRIEAEMDSLHNAYHSSMRSMYEAELQEAKRFRTERLESMKADIKTALAREELERSVGIAGLRKMRWSLLKWQKEYQRDLECSANVCHGWEMESRTAPIMNTESVGSVNALMTQLQDCSYVLSRLWEVLPDTDELQADIKGFLFTLEQALPATGETLRLYEDHLSKHGVISCLTKFDTQTDPDVFAKARTPQKVQSKVYKDLQISKTKTQKDA